MGRKNSRDLWTAKLAGAAAKGDGSAVLRTGGNAAAGKRVVAATGAAMPLPAKATLQPAATLGQGHRAAVGSVQPLPASRSVTAAEVLPVARQSTAALQRAAQAAYGARAPFHGVVLGIDPSLRGTGIAVVRFSPPEQPRLLFSLTVRNKPALTPAQCLGAIARAVAEAIETYQPTCVALEQTVYVQNVKTSLILGSARGAAVAPAAMLGLEVFEYAPTRLKQAVVGTGRASKEQVAAMVKSLLQAGRDLLPSDEADAAAAAICHAFTTRG